MNDIECMGHDFRAAYTRQKHSGNGFDCVLLAIAQDSVARRLAWRERPLARWPALERYSEPRAAARKTIPTSDPKLQERAIAKMIPANDAPMKEETCIPAIDRQEEK